MGPDHNPLALDQQLCFPLYAAAHLVVRAYAPLLKPLGLTYPQYLVMLVLWEGRGRSVGELGERLHLDSGTLTPLLKRMEKAGLVLRQRDADDERRVRVSLTEAGLALRAPALRIPEMLACRVACDQQRLSQLRGELQRFVAQLEQGMPGTDGFPPTISITQRRDKQ